MRFQLFLLIVFLFISCEKDKTPTIAISNSNHYQSDGNFLILLVGDTLECAFEYNLPIIQLSNDSLVFNIESVSDGLYQYNYWKLQPNTDTLFWSYANNLTFNENQINSINLPALITSLDFDINQFQIIGQSIPDNTIENIWSEVSDLKILKEYRESLPNSRIGISKQIIQVYDEELGFSAPYLKNLIFVVK